MFDLLIRHHCCFVVVAYFLDLHFFAFFSPYPLHTTQNIYPQTTSVSVLSIMPPFAYAICKYRQVLLWPCLWRLQLKFFLVVIYHCHLLIISSICYRVAIGVWVKIFKAASRVIVISAEQSITTVINRQDSVLVARTSLAEDVTKSSLATLSFHLTGNDTKLNSLAALVWVWLLCFIRSCLQVLFPDLDFFELTLQEVSLACHITSFLKCSLFNHFLFCEWVY